MSIEATIRVNFSGTEDFLFVAELDDVLNKEVTSFSPGDTFYVAVNHSSNVSISDIVVTDGDIFNYGTGSRSIIDTATMTSRDSLAPDEKVFNVSSPSFSSSYYGRPGGFTKRVDSIGRTTITGSTLLTPFIVRFDLTYSVKLFKIITPSIELADDETYPLSIVFYLE